VCVCVCVREREGTSASSARLATCRSSFSFSPASLIGEAFNSMNVVITINYYERSNYFIVITMNVIHGG